MAAPGGPAGRPGVASALQGTHSPSCQAKPLATSILPSAPSSSDGPWPRAVLASVGSFSRSSPTWLLPFCCLSAALVAWEMDFTLARFVTLKAVFRSVLASDSLSQPQDMKKDNHIPCAFSGGLCPSCLCPLPSPGLAGL